MKENIHKKALKNFLMVVGGVILFIVFIFLVIQMIAIFLLIPSPTIRYTIVGTIICGIIYYIVYIETKKSLEMEKYYEKLIKKVEENKED